MCIPDVSVTKQCYLHKNKQVIKQLVKPCVVIALVGQVQGGRMCRAVSSDLGGQELSEIAEVLE